MAGKRERTAHVDDPVAVGRRLREAREPAGLSQRELSFPGCSAAYISRIERGERIPSHQILRELALRCDLRESRLAWGRESPLEEEVSGQIHALREAEASGSKAERQVAYAAMGRAAGRVARSLRS
jgi:transcriptional regulator with XRE-family HTH domain